MSLRASAFSSGRWALFSIVVRSLIHLAQMMILARILVPADFGLMAIIGAIYAIVSIFVDMGFSSALIHFRMPSSRVLSSLYWFNIGVSLILMLLFFLLAWGVSLLYQQDELFPPMLAMGFALPLGALGQQFRVLAQKELRFSVLSVIEVVAVAFGFFFAVVAATNGAGVYSLIVAVLVSSAMSSVLSLVFLSEGGLPRGHFDLNGIKPYLQYGFFRLGDTVFNTLNGQADVLIGGGMVGPSAIGLYTIPKDLALRLANTIVNPVVGRVGLPVMAKVQHDKSELKSIYLQVLRMTSSINFPVYAALALWAEEIVVMLLGAQWQQAGDYMRIFALWGMIRSTGNPVGSLVYSTGRVRRAFFWNLGQLCFAPVFLFVGAYYGGMVGIAYAMLIIQVLIFYLLFYFMVSPACGASFSEYCDCFFPPLLCTFLAVLIGGLFSLWLGGNALLQVMLGGGVGFAAYIAASCVVNRGWLLAVLELVSPMLKGRGR